MLSNEAQGASACMLVGPASYSSTAAASSGWIDIRNLEGDLLVTQVTGAATGSYAGYLHHSNNNAGASFGATITFNEGDFQPIGAASGNIVQTRTVSLNSLNRYIRSGGVITTGPAFIAVSICARKKQP